MELQTILQVYGTVGFDPETGDAALNGMRLNVRDASFLSCGLIRRGDAGSALPLIRHYAPYGGRQTGSLTDVALWLWSAGEYMTATGDRILREETADCVKETVERIEAEWKNPQDHWLDLEEKGVFLTHLAIYYAGIQAVVPYLTDGKGPLLLKSIRGLIFDRFIKDGRTVSRLGDTAIHSDIVAAAVPFGMLGIEDRILIEALYKVEEELVGKGVRLHAGDTYFGGCERTDAACLLAWYYAAKGDTAKAKSLLSRVEVLAREDGEIPLVDISSAREPILLEHGMEKSRGQVPISPLSRILYGTVNETLQGGERPDAALTETVEFLHLPTGFDDPYVVLPYERFPRHPEAYDAVTVRMQTKPFRLNQQIGLLATVNGKPADAPLPMKAVTADDGDRVWEAQLGPYEAEDAVEYSFVLRQDEGDIHSRSYRFRARRWVPLDQVRSIAAEEDRIAVTFRGPAGEEDAGPAVLFRKTEAGTVRVTFDQSGGGSPVSPDGSRGVDRALLQLEGGSFEAGKAGEKLYWCLRGPDGVLTEGSLIDGKPCFEVLTDGTGTIHKLRLNLKVQPGHRWFGTGERYSHYEYSGQNVDHYVYNQYRDQGLKTYMPVPFAISSGRYSIFLDTSLYSQFRFHTRLSDLVEVEADLSPAGQRLDAYLFIGEPLVMMERFTNVSGKPLLPPKWSFGPWMSSNNWDSQAEVMKQVELTNRYGIPSTVLVIEQWSDEATFYIFNDAQYEVKDGNESFRYDEFRFPEWGRWPDPKQMVEELHSNGLKVLLWQIPIHKTLNGAVHGQRDQDERTMLEKGYHVKNGDGTPFILPYNWFKDCHIVDYTNPEAKKWWFDKRKYLVQEVGVDGFKTDGGEFAFGHELRFHDGSTGREMRNLYPNLYAASYWEFLQQYAPDGGITFSRAGYTGAQRYPLHWAGDERSTFQAFRSSVIAGLTCSMSGIPFWGWDLGGFHGDIPTAELFIRGAQMAAFCPVMQYHAETKGEFNQDRTPWNIAERTGRPEVTGLYKRYADIRMNLLPYVYDQAIRTSRSGIPMMRAMMLQYPDDAHAVEMTGQYMFGDSLLVAPVTEEGHTSKEVYFPEGSWVSLFSPEEAEGPRLVKVPAALGEIPVYMKQDSILSMNLADDYRLGGHVGNRTDRYEHLCFSLYVKDRVSTRFEDDLGYRVDMKAVREGEGLNLSWSSSRSERLTWIVRKQPSVQFAACGDQLLQLVDRPESLRPGAYAFRDGDLFLCVEGASGDIGIRA